jgi:hypothetical protein
METKTLFIGGCSDGARYSVNDSGRFHAIAQLHEDGTHTTAIYRREIIRCRDINFEVMIPNEWSMEKAIESLIERYPPKIGERERILEIIDGISKEAMSETSKSTTLSMDDVFKRKILDAKIKLLIDLSEIIEEL